jgi:hypothetical protein
MLSYAIAMGAIASDTTTLVHVILSLMGIASGFVVLFGLLRSRPMDAWTGIFLATTVLTSATGFLFPFHKFLPSHAIGILSLIVLAIAIVARYMKHMEGGWRKTYVITAVIALYFNVFVLIAQMFMKAPALHELAPTGSEPPFLIAQLIVMVLFILVGRRAVKAFR